MLTSRIIFTNFKVKINNFLIKKELTNLLRKNDEVVKSALPDEMLKVFMHYKRDEWEKFLSAVTQWDVDTYLDILP